MTEEDSKKEVVTPETVVTKDTITEINTEIQKTEDSTKESIVSEINRSNEALKAELAQIKITNEAIRAQQAAEAERQKLQAELDKEKNFVNEVNKKHIVPQVTNPTAPQAVGEPNKPKLTKKQEWAEFDRASKQGSFRAEMVPESMADDE